MIAAARKYKHRRLPIYDETPDTIVGILNTRALLLDPQIDLADAIEFPSFVPETMNLLQLLKSLQRQQRGHGDRAGRIRRHGGPGDAWRTSWRNWSGRFAARWSRRGS